MDDDRLPTIATTIHWACTRCDTQDGVLPDIQEYACALCLEAISVAEPAERQPAQIVRT